MSVDLDELAGQIDADPVPRPEPGLVREGETATYTRRLVNGDLESVTFPAFLLGMMPHHALAWVDRTYRTWRGTRAATAKPG